MLPITLTNISAIINLFGINFIPIFPTMRIAFWRLGKNPPRLPPTSDDESNFTHQQVTIKSGVERRRHSAENRKLVGPRMN